MRPVTRTGLLFRDYVVPAAGCNPQIFRLLIARRMLDYNSPFFLPLEIR